MNHLLSALACKLCRLGPNLKVGKKLYLQIIHSSQWSLLDEGASLYDRLTYPMISPLKICVQRWHHRVTQSQAARFDLTMSTPNGKSTSLLPTGRVTRKCCWGTRPPNLKPEKPSTAGGYEQYNMQKVSSTVCANQKKPCLSTPSLDPPRACALASTSGQQGSEIYLTHQNWSCENG